ncbi:MAG: extracellular solute-binding protein family 5 [Fusobacteriales bacterium]|jgi:peptide/nickel transport system substrate-binding protein|nr:extracellular solute-binding protein family 5 [Fusobacteriales bacterium]
MKQKLKILLVLTILGIFVVGCGGKEATKTSPSQEKTTEKIIKIAIDKDATSLNPIVITDLTGEMFAANIFDSLVSYKDDVSKPAPGIAEKWEISDDSKEYTFYLKKGIKFHNGTELTAKDVKYTYEQILNPENASPGKQYLNELDSIEIVDNYTIKFKLKNVYASFMLLVGSPQFGIVPADYVKEVGMDAFDRAPIGTGPFKFSEWVPDDHITLVKNKDYFKGEPNIDKAIFRPIPKAEVAAVELKSGGVDLASGLLPQDIAKFVSDDNYIIKQTPGLSYQYVGFSAVKSPYSDVRFRKAVYYATDFENAIKGIYGITGERAYSWIPPVIFANDKEYMKSKALPYNEEKAKELFDELKAEGILKNGMEIEILSPQDAFRSKIATAIASSLIKFGFKPKVQTLEFGTLLPATEKGKAGIYLLGWGSVPDPDRWTYALFHTNGGKQNRSTYSNEIVDKALDAGRSTANQYEREKHYVKAMRQALTVDYIHIPLIFKNITVVHNKKIKNFEASPQGYIYLYTPEHNVDIE